MVEIMQSNVQDKVEYIEEVEEDQQQSKWEEFRMLAY